jgi:hypothetical protein
MQTAQWTPDRTTRAKRIWNEYQQTHDLSDRTGQAAGIDPETGDVWFGEDALDIVRQRRAKGLDSPLFFERVGSATYLRKGGRR